MKMKIGLFIIFLVIGFILVPGNVFAQDESIEGPQSSISLLSLENSYIEVQAKSSSSGSKSSSSSSSKTKVKTDGDDDTDTGDASGGIPWWIFLLIGGVILVLIIIAVWYFFLR